MAATLGLLLLATLFTALGTWQSRRAAEKDALELQHRDAPSMPLSSALDAAERFARVEAHGRYDVERHILLDNQVWQGRSGVHVFTPFTTGDGTVILVNRGWLPLAADRSVMPSVPTPATETGLDGVLNSFPVPGRMVGQADALQTEHWPQLVTYMNHDDIARALGTALANHVIQLSAEHDSGFDGRDWKPSFMSAERHRGYAFQWFAMTAACIVLWLATSFRKTPGNAQ